ncbi:SET domain containing protein [Cladophialophora carrionii]|uniref:SET domain containing protein n=1 Tax=Cladophialophora carrionii TaxID=86049 RepID=A0A1C1CTA7_9EURO|nr:SET domain containing protein [Cladophialophora carrionii]
MTESSLLTTHPLPNHYPVTAAPSLASPLPNGSLSDNIQDEEEYTIKCICIYADDDGNTVYCPKCDTWQHIECYYHGKKVPDEHFCADCFPRDLDTKKATERQRRHREALEGGDRKVKRASSKSQKKKHKDIHATPEQVNGWHHDRHESVTTTRDGPPAKKPKTSHRTSGSIVSTNGETRKRAASTVQSYPSPSKSPQDLFRFPAIPTYTLDFLELYDRDEGNTNARDNEQTIQATNTLFAWRTDPSLVVSPGQQPTAKSPFVRLDQPLDQSTWPQVSVETIRKTDIEYDGRRPTWRFLRIQSPVKKNEVVGEVRGQVGMLEEYCQQKSSSNRWQELRHPDPFVFFHPHMDIYIDSRKSGTRFRYLRRSCRPNVTLKTFVSDNDETRHCFVASQDIPTGSELTTPWFLDQAMIAAEDSELGQNRRLDWVSRVLANFGDCACDAGAACLLAPFDRRFPSKSSEAAHKEKGKRKKPSKKNQTISPFSTGHATNSRAGSEPKVLDDEDQSDRRSTPDSSRSGGPSRDITPVNVAALDADPVLGNGLTARELRKIQMAEKAFAQREQEKKDQSSQAVHRKKKRTSGGSTLNTPNVNTSKQLGHQITSHPNTPSGQPSRLNDTALGSPPPPRAPACRGKSMDPPSKPQPRMPQPVYTSVAVQTDPEEHELALPPPTKRRKFSTPTQRLLRKLLADRERHGQHEPVPASPTSACMQQQAQAPPTSGDVDMKDASVRADNPVTDAATSPHAASDDTIPPHNPGATTYPLPSQAAHTHSTWRPPPTPKLNLSTLPPVPVFPSSATSASSSSTSATTPGVTTTATAQSPTLIASISASHPGLTPGVITPSPARKKLSLGDYMSRRLASTPSTEKSQTQVGLGTGEVELAKVATSPSESSLGTAEAATGVPRPGQQLALQPMAQESLPSRDLEDASMKDEGEEPEYSPPEPVEPAEDSPRLATGASVALPTSAQITIPAEVTNILHQLAQFRK